MAEATAKSVRVESYSYKDEGWIRDDVWMSEEELAGYAENIESEERIMNRHHRREARVRLYRFAAGAVLVGLLAVAVLKTLDDTRL